MERDLNYSFKERVKAQGMLQRARAEFKNIKENNLLEYYKINELILKSFLLKEAYSSKVALLKRINHLPIKKAIKKNFMFLYKNKSHSITRKELRLIKKKLKIDLEWAEKKIPKIYVDEYLIQIFENYESVIEDFGLDFYCPKTYSHHVRATLWYPPFYFYCFSFKDIEKQLKKTFFNLSIKRSEDYVIGLNSKLDQYKSVHILMLDLDSITDRCLKVLKKIKGVLFKSGRGYHFIGKELIRGDAAWRKKLLSLKNHKDLKGAIDRDHVDISLQRGYSTLRVTRSPQKPETPYFYQSF